MSTTESPTIRSATVHYGFPTVWVEPYETTDHYGDKVWVRCFYVNGPTLIFVEGAKIRKDGKPANRGQALPAVAIPMNVREALAALVEENLR